MLFRSPDDKPVTIASWSAADPADFLTTAVSELNGTSGTATYGPPYTSVSGAGQNLIGGISLQRIVGVHIPIDAPHAFVLEPLRIVAQTDPALSTVLDEYEHSTSAEQTKWTDAYSAALPKAVFKGSAVTLPPGHYGPVGPMMTALLAQARAGGLDGALISSDRFYQSDFTKALLFLAAGRWPSPTAYWVPVLVLILIVFTVAISIGVSAVTVYVRDLRSGMPLIMQLGLFLTPILYPISQVPARFRTITMVVNPIAGVVEGLRSCLFYDRAPDLQYTVIAAVASVVYLIGAFLLFKRLETGFADVS